MMLAARIARPAARSAPVRNLTQVSSEARRYSFAHAADDIIAAGSPKEMLARVKAHAEEVGGRLKHGWFRVGVTHPNSDLPPDGLPRMTWEDKVMPYSSGNIYSYTPCQMVGTILDTVRCVRGSVHHGCPEQQR